MEDILEKIRDFADRSHGEQLRKYSRDRYIVHPVRVMNICREYTEDVTILAAALLHDVVEDTPVTGKEIEDFLLTVMSTAQARRTVQLVHDLTDVYTSADYPHLNRKERKKREAERMEKISGDAQTIKYADIIDNGLDITVHDRHFAPKYLTEVRQLLQKMKKGDQALYKRAVKTVEECSGKMGGRKNTSS